MRKAIAISGVVALIAFFALFSAPPGRADPVGTLLRTALATGMLIFLGRVVGVASYRRPPHALAPRVVTTIFLTVTIEVIAIWFSPNWSVALAVWYVTLFGAGALLNRWCDAPERYVVLVAAFCVVTASLILMVLSAASPSAQTDLGSNAVLVSLWPNVSKIAAHPGDAAWTWLAWRVADRLRKPEVRVSKTATKPLARPAQPVRPV